MNNSIALREQQARQIIANKQKLIAVVVNDKQKQSLFSSAILGIAMDKKLASVSVESIIDTGIAIVQAGLNPNKLFGQAYVVPYGNVAQLQIGYKGWIALGYRNGWKFRAVAVYKCDDFSYAFGGFEDEIKFEPNFDERNDDDSKWVYNNLLGVMVYAKDSTDTIWTEFVSFKKLEKLRQASPNQKKELSNVWGTWAEEMYKAKALKYVITRLPINENIMSVAVKEDEVFSGEIVEAKQSKTIDLNEIPKAPKEVEIIEIEEPLKGDILESEFMKRGLSKDEAEKIVERYSSSEIEAILNDPASIDSLVTEFVESKNV